MRTANLKLTATIAVGVMVLAGVGTALAWSRGGPAIPSPHPETAAPLLVAADPPIEGDWLPKKATDPVPTAFPELKLPDTVNRKRDEYINSLAQHCPRVCGKDSVSIEATDDTYRRLLKARLHQARIEIRGLQSRFLIGAYTSQETTMFHHCLEDVRAVAMELWRNEPKQLIPWLEEFVILAKEWENLTAGRVTAGTDPPYALNAARRHRLEAEAALWKAKNLGRAK